MSRTRRLLDLIQILRSHRFPIAGERLAEQLGVSLRTLYRDIRTLQEQGAHIDGAPGLGATKGSAEHTQYVRVHESRQAGLV